MTFVALLVVPPPFFLLVAFSFSSIQTAVTAAVIVIVSAVTAATSGGIIRRRVILIVIGRRGIGSFSTLGPSPSFYPSFSFSFSGSIFLTGFVVPTVRTFFLFFLATTLPQFVVIVFSIGNGSRGCEFSIHPVG
jgi:hypothetical protein